MKTAVMYIRVSTIEQDYERQFNELDELSKTDNYKIVKVFEDKLSGKVKSTSRKGYNELVSYIDKHNIKQVYVWEISRVGRTLKDSLTIAEDFAERGINIKTKKEGLNTNSSNPADKFTLQVLMSVAEYELATIKERTISGTYNSIRNGGTGGGAIPQYGYKRENNKLVIDEDEAAVILDICDKYLNKDYSVKQIADYLNEKGVETRYKKLINSGTIKYKLASDLIWTDGSVARLLHKKLLTGYRKYGKVEFQNESLRIVDDSTFNAIQIKMDLKRKSKANSQKYEHILRGTLVCGNCGASMVMQKSKSGLQNHYQCYKRFSKKDKSCGSAMINIDLLNNLVYQKAKDFVVASKDVESRIDDFKSQINKNQITLNRLNVELSNIDKEESKLVDLYTKDLINIMIYQTKLQELQTRVKTANTTKSNIELSKIELQEQIKVLENKKIVDLKNPEIFKANARELIESIEVKNLSDADLVEVNDELSQMKDIQGDYIIRHKGREKIYRVTITMFDHNTKYIVYVKNTQSYGDNIVVNRINPQDKNKDIIRTKKSKPIEPTFSL